jgi:hypothetical protein
MQRVKRSTAVAVMPAMPAGGTPGFFAHPDPAGGVPATVPGFEWYNCVQEEMVAVIVAAAIGLDINDTSQLLKALRSAGVFQTAAQFDNTTKAATTAFVQRSLGNFQGQVGYTASQSLSAAQCGSYVYFYGTTAAQTITLPAIAGAINGAAISFANHASVPVTLKGNVAELINAQVSGSASSAANTLVLSPGDSVICVSDGSIWQTFGETSTNQFPANLAANGWQKLPSGLIIQWGSSTSSATPGAITNVALPLAASNGVLAVIGSSSANGSQAASTGGATTVSLSQIGIWSYAGSAVTVRWLAITF